MCLRLLCPCFEWARFHPRARASTPARATVRVSRRSSTLALAYAQAHPAQCEALLLRGVFLFSPTEVDYLFGSGGTAGQNPQAWEEYCRFVRETSDDWERESANLLGAYWQRLTCDDEEMRNAAAAAFIGYELSISKAYIDPAVLSEYLGTPSILIPFAVMEVHSASTPSAPCVCRPAPTAHAPTTHPPTVPILCPPTVPTLCPPTVPTLCPPTVPILCPPTVPTLCPPTTP